MREAPENIWLSSADSDNERQIWTDPDEGGTEYVRADLAETIRSENERLAAELSEARTFTKEARKVLAQRERLERLVSDSEEFAEKCQNERRDWQARALAAEARAEKAAEDMKERCAEIVEKNTISYSDTNQLRPRLDGDRNGLEYAAAIRSLPTESKDV